MKYYILAAIILILGAIAVTMANQDSSGKRYAVETETAVRPAYFEDMKWKPEGQVELRAPASESKH